MLSATRFSKDGRKRLDANPVVKAVENAERTFLEVAKGRITGNDTVSMQEIEEAIEGLKTAISDHKETWRMLQQEHNIDIKPAQMLLAELESMNKDQGHITGLSGSVEIVESGLNPQATEVYGALFHMHPYQWGVLADKTLRTPPNKMSRTQTCMFCYMKVKKLFEDLKQHSHSIETKINILHEIKEQLEKIMNSDDKIFEIFAWSIYNLEKSQGGIERSYNPEEFATYMKESLKNTITKLNKSISEVNIAGLTVPNLLAANQGGRAANQGDMAANQGDMAANQGGMEQPNCYDDLNGLPDCPIVGLGKMEVFGDIGSVFKDSASPATPPPRKKDAPHIAPITEKFTAYPELEKYTNISQLSNFFYDTTDEESAVNKSRDYIDAIDSNSNRDLRTCDVANAFLCLLSHASEEVNIDLHFFNLAIQKAPKDKQDTLDGIYNAFLQYISSQQVVAV